LIAFTNNCLIIEKAYTKRQWVRPKSAAIGNMALEALVTLKKNSFIVKATGLWTVTDEPYHFDPKDVLKLWHPIENQEDTIQQWQDYLWKNNIIQPERQAFREH
jgi:hypothetical protein